MSSGSLETVKSVKTAVALRVVGYRLGTYLVGYARQRDLEVVSVRQSVRGAS